MALLEETTDALKRLQDFDASTLVQEARLGNAKNFTKAVAPAERLIELYGRLTDRALQDFPDQKLNQVKQRALADYQLFEQVQKFDADRTTAERDAPVAQIVESYTPSTTVARMTGRSSAR